MPACLFWLGGAGLLLAGGCETHEPRSDFLARVQQDCRSGSKPACELLRQIAAASDGHRPHPVANSERAREALVRKDTAALLQGVARARSTPKEVFTPAPADETP